MTLGDKLSKLRKENNYTQDVSAVKQSLDTTIPTCLSWAKEIIKLFLKGLSLPEISRQ